MIGSMSAIDARSIRSLFRVAIVWLGVLVLAPLWLSARLWCFAGGGDSLFASWSEALSLVPGKPGIFCRRSFYRMTLRQFAFDSAIGFGTTLAHSDSSIGRGVYIGNRCTIGKCTIRDHATIGSNVDLLSGRHQHGLEYSDRSVQEQPGCQTMISIGRNTWIGNSSVIMASVGDGSVIGAGAVVVKPIGANAIAVGNPARVIRLREAA